MCKFIFAPSEKVGDGHYFHTNSINKVIMFVFIILTQQLSSLALLNFQIHSVRYNVIHLRICLSQFLLSTLVFHIN